MHSLDIIPKNKTPEEETDLEAKRVAFEAKAEETAKEYGLTSREVLELYATKMDKQIITYVSNEQVLDVIFSNPATEDVYWDLVEASLKSDAHESLATKDPLTGLDNRRSLDTQLEKMAGEFDRKQYEHKPTPFSLIIIDLDYFKLINDNFGHLIGDLVLKSVAEEIKHHVRPTDLACRMGGEEFAVVVNGDKEAARILAERIRSSIESIDVEKLGIDKSRRAGITTSVGVAEYTGGANHTEAIKLLSSSADTALYEAKNSGRNQVKVA